MPLELKSIPLPDINHSGHGEMFIGGRSRVATCTGVGFIGSDRLLVSSLVGQSIYLMGIDLAAGLYEIKDSIRTTFRGKDVCTDLLDFDGGMRVATSNTRSSSASIYNILDDKLFYDTDITLPAGDDSFCHGVKFLPNSSDLICLTASSGQRTVAFMALSTGECVYKFDECPWGAKDICFPSDNLAVVIYCGGSPQKSAFDIYESRFVLYELDIERGSHVKIDEILVQKCHVDSCRASENTVYVTNGSRGSILLIDVQNGRLVPRGEILDYGVPHGVDVLQGQNLLAVSDYARNTVELTDLASVNLRPWPGEEAAGESR